MKKNLLFLSLLFLGLNMAFSQTNSKTQETKKVALNVGNDVFLTKASPAELSDYFGYDNKIKEITIDNNIPEKFPTKEGFSDKKTYLTAANDWIKSNQNFIRPEFKNTTLKD